MQHGQGEGRCFASARLGTSQEVLSGQNDRNGLRLDGSGCLVALLVHSLENGRSQIQFFKFHDEAPVQAHGIGLSGCLEGQPPVKVRWDSQVGIKTTGVAWVRPQQEC